MKAAIISLGSKSSEWTAEAMRKYFDEVDMLNIKHIEINFSGDTAEVLYEGEHMKAYDCVYAKGSFKYGPLLRSITSILGNVCYMPIVSDAFTTVNDKLLTQLELQKHNIPMPRTYLASTVDEAKKILDKINYPIIMKLPQGTHGKGVMIADTKASATSMLDALSALKQPFIIQEFVETSTDMKESANDIRAIVVGNKVVAAMRRKSTSEDVRANYHSGAEVEAIPLDTYTEKLAIKVAKAIGAEIAGVDILEGAKGPMIIEANVSPGLQGITEATKIDVADKIAKYLYTRTKERTDLGKKKEHTEIMSTINQGSGKQKYISNLDFRGVRILLPELVTKLTGFEDSDDVEITAEDGKLSIKKLNIK
ncbi:RimK family alpha-L-glutamate ligase [Nanoarchaeota archaeon]